jgi:hypothetical protein
VVNGNWTTPGRVAAVLGGLALAVGTFTSPANAANGAGTARPLEPNPCAGRTTDSGTGGNLGGWSDRVIYGTWYNCGRTPGTDHVKIDVAGGYDGPCISVGYGSTGSSQFDATSWLPSLPGQVPWYAGWKRC